jgi:hypothetical protein
MIKYFHKKFNYDNPYTKIRYLYNLVENGTNSIKSMEHDLEIMDLIYVLEKGEVASTARGVNIYIPNSESEYPRISFLFNDELMQWQITSIWFYCE